MTGSTSEVGLKHLAIVLFDGVEELDAVGPWEVLAHWTQTYPADGWAVTTLSADGRPVTAAKGLVIAAHHSFAAAPAVDVLIHPGGRGTRALSTDPGHLDWIRARRREAALMTSVCTGALVYAAAGLLRERPATTYWDAIEELRGIDPSIRIDADARWVDDGDVVTSAGVSAGIDLALHLVDRLAGTARARQVRRGIQYDPEPPV
ncbi:MAG: DJ-1/PfpI family protein [Actinomycetota bacterium]|nr:DJ-1/PfpI family protein [Actinomycetota bacterium]